MIVQVSVVLRRTLWGDIDWRSDNLSGSHHHLSDDDFRSGCRNVRQSQFTELRYDSWVQTIYSKTWFASSPSFSVALGGNYDVTSPLELGPSLPLSLGKACRLLCSHQLSHNYRAVWKKFAKLLLFYDCIFLRRNGLNVGDGQRWRNRGYYTAVQRYQFSFPRGENCLQN